MDGDALESMGPIGGGDEELASDPMATTAPMDDFGMAIQEAFPDNDWTPDRTDALKSAIRLCLEEDKSGGYGTPGGGSGGGGDKLALIFGAPSKKKS